MTMITVQGALRELGPLLADTFKIEESTMSTAFEPDSEIQGALAFRNSMWALARLLEEKGLQYSPHAYLMSKDNFVALLEGLANLLSQSMKDGDCEVSQVLESVERNIRRPFLCTCEVCTDPDEYRKLRPNGGRIYYEPE